MAPDRRPTIVRRAAADGGLLTRSLPARSYGGHKTRGCRHVPADWGALELLDAHARHCLIGQGDRLTDPDGQVAELMGAVGRMMSR
jgi:hypothetical protein